MEAEAKVCWEREDLRLRNCQKSPLRNWVRGLEERLHMIDLLAVNRVGIFSVVRQRGLWSACYHNHLSRDVCIMTRWWWLWWQGGTWHNSCLVGTIHQTTYTIITIITITHLISITIFPITLIFKPVFLQLICSPACVRLRVIIRLLLTCNLYQTPGSDQSDDMKDRIPH